MFSFLRCSQACTISMDVPPPTLESLEVGETFDSLSEDCDAYKSMLAAAEQLRRKTGKRFTVQRGVGDGHEALCIIVTRVA